MGVNVFPPLSSFMTLENLLTLSELQFCHLYSGDHDSRHIVTHVGGIRCDNGHAAL